MSHLNKQRYIPKEYRQSNIAAIILFSLILICFIIFLYWFIAVFTPIFFVEVNYQYKKTIQSIGLASGKSLLKPQISIKSGYETKYPQGGVVIPSIFLDEPIVYNVDPNDESAYTSALKKGIAHASATKLPDSGGLGYYFAHSSNPSFVKQFNAVFYLLGKLKKGEVIYIWHNGQKTEYKVTKSIITKPTDVSFLFNNYLNETIVLQTCWPPGTNLERLLVFAEK